MIRLTRQQFTGLCLLLLIIGNECERVNNQVSLNNAVHQLNDKVAGLQNAVASLKANHTANGPARWFSNFGNSACPSDLSLGDVTKRFAYKSEKLQKALEDLTSKGLVMGASLGTVRELTMRAEGLADCVKAEKTRPELKSLVQDPDSGVKAQLENAAKMFIATMNASSLTSWKPDPAIGCTMDLKFDNLVELGDDAIKTFQKAFYGEACDVVAYKASQPYASRKILEIIEDKVKKAMEEVQSGKSEANVIEELLVQEAGQLQDGESSFLEAEDAASMPLVVLIFVILFIAFMVMLICRDGCIVDV